MVYSHLIIIKMMSKDPLLMQIESCLASISFYFAYGCFHITFDLLNTNIATAMLLSVKNHPYNFCLTFSVDYPYFVDISRSIKGHQRILNNGYSYGICRRYPSSVTRLCWRCTKLCEDKRHCPATIETDIIDGYTMMRYKNQKHRCTVNVD